MFHTRSLLFFLYVLIPLQSFSQQIVTIRKDRPFAFFQIGNKSDTISKNKSDRFLLQVPDSMISNVVISVENGKLALAHGDTLLRFTYVQGHKYESFFEKEEDEKTGKTIYKFTTAVNGASVLPDKEVLITFFDRRKPGKPVLENRFIFVK